jgi:hypothetical protein
MSDLNNMQEACRNALLNAVKSGEQNPAKILANARVEAADMGAQCSFSSQAIGQAKDQVKGQGRG